MTVVRLVVLAGFLGAGKTTALMWLAHTLEARGARCAVVLNDQGEGLVDTASAQSSGLRVGEVTGGCFCCRFDDLMATVIDLVERGRVTIVLAEAVGSCADLKATVIRPLRAYYGARFSVAPLAVFVEPPRLRELASTSDDIGVLVPYLFEKQLEDADLIVLNKADLLDVEEKSELLNRLSSSYRGSEVACVSARTGYGMDALLDRLLSKDSAHSGLRTIDYATYARAEAELAWLNANPTVTSNNSSATTSRRWLTEFMSHVSEQCARRGLWIGHVKARLHTSHGVSKASLVRAGDAPGFDLEDPLPFDRADLLVNARVRAQPEELDELVLDGLAHADALLSTCTTTHAVRAFSPPPPRPTHRLEGGSHIAQR